MSTGVDMVLDDKQAQEFWLRRVIAYVIDVVIIYVPIEIISSYAWSLGYAHQAPWVIAGTLMVVYTALFEAELGYTIGKRIMDLEVVSLDPRPYDIKRGLIRNITKIHFALLIIDMIGGLFQEGISNQRYLDTVGNCEVVDTKMAQWRRSQGFSPPPIGSQQPPPVTVQPEAEAEPPMAPEPEVVAPEPPDEDALQEVPEEPPADPEGHDIGIPPPPVPPEPLPLDETIPGEAEGEEEYEEMPPPDDDGK
ncbi:MAG: hypothetical protein GQ558_08020 [Thermoplasmata archaeon]|nr:hypothetical protein [Thermoplasmata archaeon]